MGLYRGDRHCEHYYVCDEDFVGAEEVLYGKVLVLSVQCDCSIAISQTVLLAIPLSTGVVKGGVCSTESFTMKYVADASFG